MTFKIVKFLIFSVLLKLSVTAEICEYKTGDNGNFKTCSEGYYAKGACSSGRTAACSDPNNPSRLKYTTLKCCQQTYNTNDRYGCVTHAGEYGDNRYCNAYANDENPEDVYYQEFTGLCTSDGNKDCKDQFGKNHSFTYECCTSDNLRGLSLIQRLIKCHKEPQ